MSGTTAHLGIVSLGADDPERLMSFYARAFGDDLWGRNLTEWNKSFSTWMAAGVKFSICSRHHPDDKVMFHMIVDSLEETTHAIECAGGKLVTGPLEISVASEAHDGFSANFAKMKLGPASDVTESMGKTCIYDDPEGNPFGAMELEPWAAKLFSGSKVGKFEKAESSLGREVSDAFNSLNP